MSHFKRFFSLLSHFITDLLTLCSKSFSQRRIDKYK